MKKLVQLIKQKASLGLSLILVSANQIAAQAETCSDKTKWLTSNLEKPVATKKSASTSLKALTAKSDSSQKTNSIVVNCSDDPSQTIKLRPFMPNRKLPSRHDLELALIEQKAKLAQEGNNQLSGQVSTFVMGNNRAASKEQTTSAIRNNLAQSKSVSQTYFKPLPAKTAQASFSFMRGAEQHLLSTVKQQMAHPGSELTNLPVNRPTNYPEITHLPENQIDIEAIPPISTDWLSEKNGPSAFSLPAIMPNQQTQANTSGFGTAGPPPFPLNLLPEASLKQLVKGLAGNRRSNSMNTPSVAFGSWHNPCPLNSVSPQNFSNKLPYAGFQSHLTKPYTSSRKKINYHRGNTPTKFVAHKNSAVQKQKTREVISQRNSIIQNKSIENQIRVATYPSYATQSLKPWNFAQ